MSDATQPISVNASPALAHVHAGDLLLEMTLWYGGARAIAVNGARLMTESTIMSEDESVVVDGRPIGRPVHILAIGNPDLLRGVLLTRGGAVERIREKWTWRAGDLAAASYGSGLDSQAQHARGRGLGLGARSVQVEENHKRGSASSRPLRPSHV